MKWISRLIESGSEAAAWVDNPQMHITKASLTFPAKVWWAVVRAQLRSTGNENTISPLLSSLVACIMVGYPLNVGRIIITEMRDCALNERASLQFLCLKRRLCVHANIPPNKLVDRYVEATKVTAMSKIKYVANPLYGS
ncbi:hypothetical protein R3W88_024420 [Solanum pinnatisectum]|uniref:Putative plant transposon protein domain-containing protein n=1 Tax=Solanum pinnatisectum TaxID=50273 RepID=A0AAV9M209_9SOLN|nr:hypothetical protein R3W88_024420 [Solanum pinnatisectum]